MSNQPLSPAPKAGANQNAATLPPPHIQPGATTNQNAAAPPPPHIQPVATTKQQGSPTLPAPIQPSATTKQQGALTSPPHIQPTATTNQQGASTLPSPTQPPTPIHVQPPTPLSPSPIQQIVDRLKLNIKFPEKANINEQDIHLVCAESKKSLLIETTVLDLLAPVIVVGDIHGQIQDLERIFRENGQLETITNKKYLFLGDYVDRGPASIETIILLLAYKCLYKDRIYLLRGNHETRMINHEYGFRREIRDRGFPDTIWELYNTVFDCMPLCAFVAGIGKRIFCTHGGLSPLLESPHTISILRRIQRPVDIPDIGIFCDLVWADPVRGVIGYEKNDRGISSYFSDRTIETFCQAYKVTYVVRAHQVKDSGYEWFSPQFLTIFSAPRYARGEYGNDGAVLLVESMAKKIVILGVDSNNNS